MYTPRYGRVGDRKTARYSYPLRSDSCKDFRPLSASMPNCSRFGNGIYLGWCSRKRRQPHEALSLCVAQVNAGWFQRARAHSPETIKSGALPFQGFNALRTVDTRAPFLEAGEQIHVYTLTRTGNGSRVTTRPPPRRGGNVKRRAATCAFHSVYRIDRSKSRGRRVG